MERKTTRLIRWAGLAPVLALSSWLLSAAPSAPRSGQERQDVTKPLQYEVSVVLKLINVVVVDKDGKPVKDLTLDDFTVTDNGQPVKLTEFEKHMLDAPPEKTPAKQPAEKQAEARVPALAPAAPLAQASTRKFFLLFDFAFNNAKGITKARTAAQHFLETQVRLEDEVGVMTYSMIKGVTVHEYLTRDHDKVRQVVDSISSKDIAGRAHEIELEYWLMAQEPGGLGEQFGDRTLPRTADQFIRESSRDEAKRIAEVFILKLTALAKALRYVEGSKHFILFSTGIPSSMIYGSQAGNLSGDERFDPGNRVLRTRNEEMYKEFAASNCVVYAFDTRESAMVTDLFAYDRMTFESVGPNGGRGIFTPQGMFEDATNVFQDDKTTGGNTLRRLTDQTGGKYFSNINMYEKNLDQVQSLTGTYYVLGYSIGASEDGRFHEVKVEVKRKGCQVRAQTGYFNPKPYREYSDLEKNLHLFELALNERSFSRLPVSFPISGLSFASADGSGLKILAKVPAEVTAKFDGRRVEYVALVFDAKNDVRDIRRLETYPRPHLGQSVVFTSETALEPGEYTCRLVIRDMDSGLSAASSVRISVPAPARQGLRLGTPLLLQEETGCNFLEAGPGKAHSTFPWAEIYPYDRMALSPVSGPVSPLTPRLLAVVPISVPEVGEPDVALLTRIIDAATGEAVPAAVSLVGATRHSAGETVTLEIPLPKLKPGKYFIYINAEDRVSHTKAHSQTVLVIQEG